MCGRFTLAAPGEALADEFDLPEVPEVAPRYNIAPTQPVLVVRAGPDGRRTEWMKWGIAFPPGKGRRPPLLINARAETLGERPAWKDALWRRRCLVPADGFYEWKGDDGGACTESGWNSSFMLMLNNLAVVLYQNARHPLRNSFTRSKAVTPVCR
jgi:putative SOS response-associated peptidase YedK